MKELKINWPITFEGLKFERKVGWTNRTHTMQALM